MSELAPYGESDQDEVRRVVAEIWISSRESIEQRIDLLEERVSELTVNGRDGDQFREAGLEAHKLVGSLGMFGFSEASRLARQIELSLQAGTPASGAHGELCQLVSALRHALHQESGQT